MKAKRRHLPVRRLLGGRALATAVPLILVLLLLPAPARGDHAKTDHVTTDDGSVYVGDIKGVQFASVDLDTDPAGLLSIEWRHVTALTSTFQYRVELTGGVLHYGSLGTPPGPGRLVIVTEGGPVEAALADVVSISPIQRGFWKALDGSINFGLTYTQSSEAFQYNLAANVERQSPKHYSSLSAQSIFSTQSGADSAAQHNLKFLANQITERPWGPFELAQAQSNTEQGYDLRVLAGGGASNYLVERSTDLLVLNLGAVYNREAVTDSSEVDQSAEALAGVEFRRFKRGSHSPSLQVSLMTFTTLASSWRFRTAFSFNMSWKIVGDFKFNTQVTNSYDSQPPGTGASHNDVTLVTSVGWTF